MAAVAGERRRRRRRMQFPDMESVPEWSATQWSESDWLVVTRSGWGIPCVSNQETRGSVSTAASVNHWSGRGENPSSRFAFALQAPRRRVA